MTPYKPHSVLQVFHKQEVPEVIEEYFNDNNNSWDNHKIIMNEKIASNNNLLRLLDGYKCCIAEVRLLD